MRRHKNLSKKDSDKVKNFRTATTPASSKTAKKALHDVMCASNNLSNLRLRSAAAEIPVLNYEEELLRKQSLAKVKEEDSNEIESKDRQDRLKTCDGDDEEDDNEDNDDYNYEDAEEDGMMYWPEEKRVYDGPIDEIEFNNSEFCSSSLSLSDVFDLYSSKPNDQRTTEALKVFSDDSRFTFENGLILFEDTNDDESETHEENQDSTPVGGFFGWVGEGINRLVNNNALPKKTEETNIQYYRGAHPPHVQHESHIFDARPPPIDEIIVDANAKNGETPNQMLQPQKGERHEPSEGMARIRRLRRLRRECGYDDTF